MGIYVPCSWYSNPIYNDAPCGIFFVMLIILCYLKQIWKIKILPHLPRFLSCLFGLQKLLRLISLYHGDAMGNCLLSKWFKTTNCKTLHLNFSDFFRQAVTKITGKTAIWAISFFYPLPPLNNVEKQQVKFGSGYVMGLQHCRRGNGDF